MVSRDWLIADPEIRTLSQSRAAPVAVAVPGKTDVPRDAVVLQLNMMYHGAATDPGLLGAVPVHLRATGCVYSCNKL